MDINNIFNNVFLINLKNRPDKLNDSTILLNKYNIKFNVFVGINGNSYNHNNISKKYHQKLLRLNPGVLGCLLSHINIIQYAKENNLENILIFEDDIDFSENFLEILNCAIKDLPKDWDMFYLGGNPKIGQNTKISNHIYKSTAINATHSYMINHTIYDLILNANEYDYAIDTLYHMKIHKNVNTYIINPTITCQRSGISDIRGAYRNYIHLKDINLNVSN